MTDLYFILKHESQIFRTNGWNEVAIIWISCNKVPVPSSKLKYQCR